MTILSHTLGFPRIGLHRELKQAEEKYWNGKISKKKLFNVGSTIRKYNWQKQKDCGIDLIPVGDFSWYDHVLTTSLMVGNIPKRYKNKNNTVNIDTLFNIARGKISKNKLDIIPASEMTKWFNTNYHYIVPEFVYNQEFSLMWTQLFDEIDEALKLGFKIKPVLLGPISYLWLGKVKGKNFDKLSILPKLINVYQKILKKIQSKGIDWVQIDEPILTLELPKTWIESYNYTYDYFKGYSKILLTTYFDSIMHQINIIKDLPIDGLHIDLTSNKNNISFIENSLPKNCIMSLGVINGRNIWKSDLKKIYNDINNLPKERKIWVASSCSLMHSPIDLNLEINLNQEIKDWFAFSVQKCIELSLLSSALNKPNKINLNNLSYYSAPIKSRLYSDIVNDLNVQNRLKKISKNNFKRKMSYEERIKLQKKLHKLPKFPTTTIGSFPQTKEIRKIRFDFKSNNINKIVYKEKIKKYIKNAIEEQENLNLDVLVHGEFERNDMVEYFGEKLNGFIFTKNGWVQSYGSRCVKPPIIVGDISRKYPITVKWTNYAQSLTKKPVKGMLTGPITILLWSFVREDIDKKTISNQIALSIKDEVKDLENSGIKIIQIDEPAFAEGLPLKYSNWKNYLKWASKSFRLSSSSVKNTTQIHTHMCYCEFNNIIKYIESLDADVISIETARSDMEILESFKKFNYKNDIGLGVYDIHSPIIPNKEFIIKLIKSASKYISINRIWINPDCGLKTRKWNEVILSLKNMVSAAKFLRKTLFKV